MISDNDGVLGGAGISQVVFNKKRYYSNSEVAENWHLYNAIKDRLQSQYDDLQKFDSFHTGNNGKDENGLTPTQQVVVHKYASQALARAIRAINEELSRHNKEQSAMSELISQEVNNGRR